MSALPLSPGTLLHSPLCLRASTFPSLRCIPLTPRYLYAFLLFFLLLCILGQRFVHVYTAAAWLDALCQLATCFILSTEEWAQMAAE